MLDPVIEVDVLIVGGGPVGLATAVECSRNGLTCLVAERHPGTSIFPKARLITTRTMELVRSWGLQDAVERAGLPREDSLAVGVASSLLADDFHRAAASIEDDAPHSPTYAYICAQDEFEVILKAHAEAQPGVDVRFGTRATIPVQDADGVTAELSTGETVRARYCVAADGGRSPIRRSLGIEVDGPPPIGHMVSIMVEADLAPRLEGRRCALYFIRGEVPCAVEAVDNRRWMVQSGFEPDKGGSVDDFTPEVCVEIVKAAVGDPELDVRLIGIMPWLQQTVTARSYRSGRIFLAGDSAHVSTPQGGFGMNCGIQDAHNLVWKLAAVLEGRAGEGLLDTYEAERHPIGVWTVAESLNNAMITYAMMEGQLTLQESIEQQAGRRSSEGLVLGFSYDSAAVVPDGTPAPAPADPYKTFVPAARPGHRAPHVPLAENLSTLDLLGPGFTLLCPEGSGWPAVEIDGVRVREVPGEAWAKEYEIGSDGAVLVRPDGHVAWRDAGGPADAAVLRGALDRVLARPSIRRP
ncbi:FAD-dependent monooxygenase [Pseudonocardia nematodicida]|uniref:FAD-dependent monooxygenase n=1 Tax=Pseudonocardia nematodicida TaxID=1206997 RepID=A0ABV1K7L4_9PSEU